jgi:hypothetical protein
MVGPAKQWALGVALGAALLAGCSGSAKPSGADANPTEGSNVLQDVAGMLRDYASATGRNAARLADLAQLESLYPHGYQAVKSGEVVVLWGASMAGEEGGGSEKVVAYEKKVPTDGGHVLLENGQVKSMTSVEFAAAPKAGKK